MAKKQTFDPSVLGDAEIVVTDTTKNAVALAYKPGQTPEVLALAKSSRALKELLWCASELGLPTVESSAFNGDLIKQLKVGEAIPEGFYRLAALSLASVQKNREAPVPITVVRPVGGAPQTLKKRLQRKVEEIVDLLQVAQLEVALGEGVEIKTVGPIVNHCRESLELDLGLLLSGVEVAQDEKVEAGHYSVRIRGVEAASGKLGQASDVARPLLESVQIQAWRLLGYRETEALLEALKKSHPTLYKELFPSRLTLGALRQVLRNLLREGLSIRDLPGILEAILDHLEATHDPDLLTEYVRSALSYYISSRFSDRSGRLNALMLEPTAERVVVRGLRESASALWLDLDLDESLKILGSVARGLEKASEDRLPAVLLCSPKPRRFLRRLLEPSFPFLPILSYSEVAPLTEVNTVAMVGR